MINGLLETIQKQLYIPRVADDAPDLSWLFRTIYSVAGKMALASLWDHYDETNDGIDDNDNHDVPNISSKTVESDAGFDTHSVSIQHFKNRVRQILDAYTSIYPEIRDRFSEDKDALVQEIYDIYCRTGHFYHTPYRLSPAMFRSCTACGVTLYRGISPDDKYSMSGLGFYDKTRENDTIKIKEQFGEIADMFGLQTQKLSDYLAELQPYDGLEPLWSGGWSEGTKFLNLNRAFGEKYLQDFPTKNGRVSLARCGDQGHYIYYFYRFSDGQFIQKQIPDWRVDDFRTPNHIGYGEYRRITVALLDHHRILPPITAIQKRNFIEICLGYRLPPSEEDFFKLYSWPIDFAQEAQENFNRVMTSAVYPLFKQVLETIGYHFEGV